MPVHRRKPVVSKKVLQKNGRNPSKQKGRSREANGKTGNRERIGIYERTLIEQQKRVSAQRKLEAERFANSWITDAQRRIKLGETTLLEGITLTLGSSLAISGLWRRRARRTIIDVLQMKGMSLERATEASKKVMRQEYDTYFIRKANPKNGGLSNHDINLLLDNDLARKTLRMIAERTQHPEKMTIRELLKTRDYTPAQAKKLIEGSFDITDKGTMWLTEEILKRKFSHELVQDVLKTKN